jgi:DNA repair ATPase RecN
VKATAALLLVGVALACASSRSAAVGSLPSASRDWIDTFGSVQSAVIAKRFEDADKELTAFAERYPGTAEAREAVYWRAVYRLDPANPKSDPASSIADFKRYLTADSTNLPRRAEAGVLQRLAASLDSAHQARRAADNGTPLAPIAPETTSVPSAREQELMREIQRLKDELDKDNAELDRIKKRLTPPASR